MSDTGWVSPGTVVSDSSVGTVAWSDPNNVKVDDFSWSNASYTGESSADSEYLKTTNFGFTIPVGFIIKGIEIEVKKERGTNTVNDVIAKIVKSDGSIGGSNKAKTSTDWSISGVTHTYGGDSDLWGETWSVNDINDVDFGFVISARIYDEESKGNYASVNYIKIKVYYTEGGTPTVGVKYPLPAFKRSSGGGDIGDPPPVNPI